MGYISRNLENVIWCDEWGYSGKLCCGLDYENIFELW